MRNSWFHSKDLKTLKDYESKEECMRSTCHRISKNTKVSVPHQKVFASHFFSISDPFNYSHNLQTPEIIHIYLAKYSHFQKL
jgi:hypothetical protein